MSPVPGRSMAYFRDSASGVKLTVRVKRTTWPLATPVAPVVSEPELVVVAYGSTSHAGFAGSDDRAISLVTYSDTLGTEEQPRRG